MTAAAIAMLMAMVAASAAAVTVHLVPHTHDDIGWLKTVDEYQYGLNLTIQPADVNSIIDSAIGQLLEDPARRFTYVEIGFFSRWFNQQSEAMKANVRQLAVEGRLQFANGGWCMHDEANTHFVDMIDQTTLGHRFLKQHVGPEAIPRVGWQIDPFGHSATQAAVLSAKAGFLATYHARIDYQDYAQREKDRSREFWWQSSPSLPDQVVFGGVLLHTTYCAPSPFSYDVLNVVPEVIANAKTNFVNDNENSPQYNVPELVETFVRMATSDAAVTAGSHILWPMGCDFNYIAGALWFVNLDKLIAAVNADGRVRALYSTPLDYTKAKLAENATFPWKTDDFFPYADGPHQFWTGYFTSRAALKRYIRQLSSYWTAARQLEALAGIPSGEVPRISDALGIAQHHDAVAGTAKQHVAFDYAKRLHEGYVDDLVRVGESAAALFSASSVVHCPRMNESECAATADLVAKGTVTVVVWNSNAHATVHSVEIPVPSADVLASGANVTMFYIVPAPRPTTNYADSNALAMPFVAVVGVALPPLGPAAFTLTHTKTARSGALGKSATPTVRDGLLVVYTKALQIGFSNETRTMMWVKDLRTETTISMTQDWCTFPSSAGDATSLQAGGAYIFRPVTNSTCSATAHTQHTADSIHVIAQGSDSFVVEQTFGYVTQRVIGRGDTFEIEFTVHGISIADGLGKELIARVQTNITNVDALGRTVFYTDSNGRELQKRVKDYRKYWNFVQTEEVAGNYYPVDALMLLNDSHAQLNVFTDAPVGGGSVRPGEMYLTVHRRLVHDDSRGVSEPLNETEYITSYAYCNAADSFFCGAHYGPALRIRGRLTFTVSATQNAPPPMRRVRELLDEKYFAPLVLFSDTPIPQSLLAVSLLRDPSSFPSPLQLVTVQLIDAATLILRIAHRFAVDEDAANAVPVTVSVLHLLSIPVRSVDEYSLTTMHLLHENVDVVSVSPMDFRTFVAHL